MVGGDVSMTMRLTLDDAGLLAVLMHASYTGWLLVPLPAASFEQSLIWQTVVAVALWLLVIAAFVQRRSRPATPLTPASIESARSQ